MRNALLSVSIITALGIAPAHPRAECALGVPVVFRNVRVLAMNGSSEAIPAIVTVERGRIRSIAPAGSGVPSSAQSCIVDGAGGTLLPGLTDMHVHTDASEMPLFLANGITMVREMNGSPEALVLRDRIARGEIVAPRLLVASPLLTASKLQYHHRLISSVADARAAGVEFTAAHYDYLKIYDGLSKEEYAVFVAASRASGIPLDGHIPQDVGLAGALAAGQHLQHMDKIAFSLSGHSADTTKFSELRRLFDGKKAWVTPTLASLAAMDMARTSEYAEHLARPEMRYVDSVSMGWWRSLSSSAPPKPRSQFYRYMIAVLKELRKTDARFLLGTDAANPLMVAGFSVHDELETLVRDAGFSPYDAIAMATRNVGEFLGDSTVGRIAPNARADLVLVAGDPLRDISVLRNPVGVMRDGVWLDRGALEKWKRD